MYTVVSEFKDRDGRFYRVGDTFPAQGAKKQTPARIKELSSTNNSYGRIFIEKNKAQKEE